jgi:hypothetical protein
VRRRPHATCKFYAAATLLQSPARRDVRDEKTNGESTNKKILRCLLVVSLVVSLVVLLVTLLAITSIYRKCALVST